MDDDGEAEEDGEPIAWPDTPPAGTAGLPEAVVAEA